MNSSSVSNFNELFDLTTTSRAFPVLTFSKWKDCSIAEVVFRDPDFFFWALAQRVFEKYGLQEAADEIYRRATRIRIPQHDGEQLVAEYAHLRGRGFTSLDIVPATRSCGLYPRWPYIDLSMARQLSPRRQDKSGSRELLNAAMNVVFGGKNPRRTSQFCEAFFADDNNFIL